MLNTISYWITWNFKDELTKIKYCQNDHRIIKAAPVTDFISFLLKLKNIEKVVDNPWIFTPAV